MKITLNLDEDFIEKLAQIEKHEDLYAALWVLMGVKPLKRYEDGGAIRDLGKSSRHPMRSLDIYRLGYIRALMDLGQPIVYDSELPLTQEFLGRAFDALGLNILDKLEEAC